ncbi:MAG TPA: DUF5916 domain-containing protein [Chitinophagaceae bacterium]|nr:DUF5916 domain-containing protein [Chitinophagaceae bacterium]
MRNQTTCLLFACFLFSRAQSQTADIFRPDSVRKEITAVRIRTSLHIDGVLNEPEWAWAPPSPHFTQIEPYQGSAPQFETEVKVLYNQQNLYVGLFARDSMGRKAIRATDFKRDFNFLAHDLITLTVDGFNDRRNAMCFATNAYGVQRDYLSFDDLYYDVDWDGLWMVRTTRTDSGWYAEMEIPWQTLRYRESADSVQNWGFNVYRNRRLTNEITAFSPFPRVFSASRMEYAGLLKNLQPPPPKSNIRLQPYVLSSLDRYRGADSGAAASQSGLKLGGDLKWAINSNTVLDLTANTDFAQADADLQVNNITRFSVFFPEKRQFFLENASLFSPGIQQAVDGSGGMMNLQPFFSRTIGLDSAGDPIPIVAGGRFVSRSTRQNYGAILMRQKGVESSPATNFFVGRYSRNFGEQNRVGGLLSVKNSAAGNNTEATMDGFFRLGQSQSLNTILTFSGTGATGRAAQQGFAGIAQYYKSTNHYKIWVTQSVVTKNFDPQMGFVSRTDVIGTTPGMNWYYRGRALPFKKILRALEPGFLPEFYFQASTGRFIERSLYFWPVWFNFQNGAYFGYSITPVYQHLTDYFRPLDIPIAPGDYHYYYHEILGTTDPSKFLSLAGDFKWGQYFNGRILSGDWKLQFAPIPHISVLAEFNRNHFSQVGEAKESKTVDLYIIQGRFALNPRLQLIGFYQKNSLDNSQSYHFRFAWEYKPLSYVYLIFNHGSMMDPLHPVKQSEDHLMAKISYLKQL